MESRISESGKKTMKQLGFGALLLYIPSDCFEGSGR